MDSNEILANTTPGQLLALVVPIFVCLSVIVERIVSIIKGVIPFLFVKNEDDPKKEGWRQSILQSLAVVTGIGMTLLTWPFLKGFLPSSWETLPTAIVFGFLASGGSALWSGTLGYVKNAKDLKKEKVRALRKKNS
jgi:hypothetical protein